MICKGNAEPSNFKLGSLQISKICKGLVTLWENWKETTGALTSTSKSWGPYAIWSDVNIIPMQIQTRWNWAGSGSGPTASFKLTFYFADGTTGTQSFSGSGRDTTVTTNISVENQKPCTKIILNGSDTVGAGVSKGWSDNYPYFTKWKQKG